MSKPDDLWPEDIVHSSLIAPVTVLKEQAALLGEKSRQTVKAEVTSQSQAASSADGTAAPFVHRFNIVAPTLNYRHELFYISHGVSFYPLTLTYLNTAGRRHQVGERNRSLAEGGFRFARHFERRAFHPRANTFLKSIRLAGLVAPKRQ